MELELELDVDLGLGLDRESDCGDSHHTRRTTSCSGKSVLFEATGDLELGHEVVLGPDDGIEMGLAGSNPSFSYYDPSLPDPPTRRDA
jgi:hypothetical protein